MPRCLLVPQTVVPAPAAALVLHTAAAVGLAASILVRALERESLRAPPAAAAAVAAGTVRLAGSPAAAAAATASAAPAAAVH